jgi:3-isopropylmalate dehydrogenase
MKIRPGVVTLFITSFSWLDAFVLQPNNALQRNSLIQSMAVSKKDSYSITLLPGDGIGPEITEATKLVLEALCKRKGFNLELKEALIGGAAIDAANDPFPESTLQQCLASDSVLLACIGGYKVSQFIWDFIAL